MRDFWNKCKVKLIPHISDELVEIMAAQIRPVQRVGKGRYREILIDGVHRTGTAFTWSPKLGRLVRIYDGTLNSTKTLTFHTWAYYGFFKPSLKEAYACINGFVPDWSMVRYFCLNSDGMGAESIVGDFHVCPCTLFGGEEDYVRDESWETDAAELVKENSSPD